MTYHITFYFDTTVVLSVSINYVNYNIQCETKKSSHPCGFLTFFSQTDRNFLINFYTHIMWSFIH